MEEIVDKFDKLNITYVQEHKDNCLKIQKWWVKYNCIIELRKVYNYLRIKLTHDDLQDLSNKCNSINMFCKGDGSGLLGGCLIDILLTKMFENKLTEYKEHHKGETDMKIYNICFSLKKINGKSTIALDWSKNNTTIIKNIFSSHIIIINLKEEQWWKDKPNKLGLLEE